PERHALLYRVRKAGTSDHVSHRKAAAGLQHSERLSDHLTLVTRQVDDTVGNDDVNRVRRKRYGLDVTLEKLHILGARTRLVLECKRKHLVCHVQAVRSEEHTSELQSRENLVCRLLLEKK